MEPTIEQQCSLLIGGGALGVIVALGKLTLLNDYTFDVRIGMKNPLKLAVEPSDLGRVFGAVGGKAKPALVGGIE